MSQTETDEVYCVTLHDKKIVIKKQKFTCLVEGANLGIRRI